MKGKMKVIYSVFIGLLMISFFFTPGFAQDDGKEIVEEKVVENAGIEKEDEINIQDVEDSSLAPWSYVKK